VNCESEHTDVKVQSNNKGQSTFSANLMSNVTWLSLKCYW